MRGKVYFYDSGWMEEGNGNVKKRTTLYCGPPNQTGECKYKVQTTNMEGLVPQQKSPREAATEQWTERGRESKQGELQAGGCNR